MGAVEGGVETGDLHGVRKRALRGADAGQIVRLVQRRQRAELLQFRKPLRVEHDGFGERDAAMHHPVPDRGDRYAADLLFEKLEHDGQRRGVIGNFSGVERRIRELLAGPFGLQMRRRAEALDLAAHAFGRLRSKVEQRELDRG